MVNDSRNNTKVYLDAYLSAPNMLKDGGVVQLITHVMYSDPDIPIKRLFYDQAVDCFFCVGTPESKTDVDWDGTIIGYNEAVPITIFTIDTSTVTGTKARWTCEAELRRVVETFPIGTGSLRILERISNNEQDMGGWTLYSVTYKLTYQRDTA